MTTSTALIRQYTSLESSSIAQLDLSDLPKVLITYQTSNKEYTYTADESIMDSLVDMVTDQNWDFDTNSIGQMINAYRAAGTLVES